MWILIFEQSRPPSCTIYITVNGTYERLDHWFAMKRYYENWPGYGSPRDIVFFLHPSFDLSPIKGWNGRGPSANLLPKIGWNNNTSRERAVVKIERRRYSKTCGRLNYNPIPWWEGYYFYLKKEKSNSLFPFSTNTWNIYLPEKWEEL